MGKTNEEKNLIVVCKNCNRKIKEEYYKENLGVCPFCAYHHIISARERLNYIYDNSEYMEFDNNLKTLNPLNFYDKESYYQKLEKAREKTNIQEAIITAFGKVNSFEIYIGVMEFNFLGGSMGSVVGEKIARLMERAIENRRPILIVLSTGGARMQEGMLSLFQMIKTSMLIAKLNKFKIPYFTLLTYPSTGGCLASFGMLGDVIFAEKNALIGFAGPRVVEQSIGKKLPDEFQTSSFQLNHGFVDCIVDRREFKDKLTRILQFCTKTQ